MRLKSKKFHSSFKNVSDCSSCMGKRCVHSNTLKVLFEALSNEISSTSEPEWAGVEVTADSGACDTVIAKEDCKHTRLVSSRKSQAGFRYEVASGLEIPNQGERTCIAMTEDNDIPKRVDFQVVAVYTLLLSVTKCADMGFDRFLNESGGSSTKRKSQWLVQTMPLRTKMVKWTWKTVRLGKRQGDRSLYTSQEVLLKQN